MNEQQINELYKYLYNSEELDNFYPEEFKQIKQKYEIKDINEEISIRKALYFIREVFDLDIIYYDKFLRYARKYNVLIEKKGKEEQRNWKLGITYKGIFDLLLTPLYIVLKNKEKL